MSEAAATLRERLAARAPEFRPLADNVLAAVRRIDLVALDSAGVAHAIVEARPGEDAAALTHAVAATAWLSARLSDWAQLAPDAGIDVATPARAVVVARVFHPDTIAVADLLGRDCVRLVRIAEGAPDRPATPPTESPGLAGPVGPPRSPAAPAPVAERGPSAAAAEPPSSTAPKGTASSRFRTGLVSADLGFGSS